MLRISSSALLGLRFFILSHLSTFAARKSDTQDQLFIAFLDFLIFSSLHNIANQLSAPNQAAFLCCT